MTAIHLVRARDPLTSYAAAVRSRTFATSHKERILAAMRSASPAPAGLTAAEIAESSGLTVVQIDRRLHELQKAGRARVLKCADGTEMARGRYLCWGLV